MTAADVDVPGIGDVKKEYVYGGVALVAGIGGYAWWKARKGSGSNAPVVLNPNDVVPATDYQPSPTGNATQNVDSTGDALTTNAKWTTYVVEKLASYGYDPQVASASLGKWISRSAGPYSSVDVEVIQRGIGLAGYPPENGPWTVPAVSTNPPPSTGGDTPNPSTVLDSSHFNTAGWSAEALKSPWRITTALAGESWKDITARVYSLNPTTQSARINEVAAYLEKTNKAKTGVNAAGNGPQTGSKVVYR